MIGWDHAFWMTIFVLIFGFLLFMAIGSAQEQNWNKIVNEDNG